MILFVLLWSRDPRKGFLGGLRAQTASRPARSIDLNTGNSSVFSPFQKFRWNLHGSRTGFRAIKQQPKARLAKTRLFHSSLPKIPSLRPPPD